MLPRSRNPLEPFATTVSAVMVVLVVTLVAGTVFGVVDGNVDMFGFGEPDICLDEPNISMGGGVADAPALTEIVKPGARASTGGITGCLPHPTAWQKALNVATQMPSEVFGMVMLFLLWLLVRGARRDGPFASANARRVRLIGWWLIAGGLASVNIEGAAKTALLRMMFRDSGLSWVSLHVPWTVLLIGLGMLTVARILAAAAVMRADVEATI